MNNLTKAYQENTGFRSIIQTVAIWMDVLPHDAESAREWFLDEPSNCEEVEYLTAELRRVSAENNELRQKIKKLKEVLR